MKKSHIAILLTLSAIVLHMYLSLHYYPVKYGESSGGSVCNINATFNCDSVAASEYAAFLGIPMAIWGAATNLVLFFFLSIPLLRLTEAPEKFVRGSFYISTFILFFSVIMGVVSLLFLSTYCLFCIGAYVISIIVFELVRRLQAEYSELKSVKFFDMNYLRMPVMAFIAIPIVSFISHKSFTSTYEDKIKQQGQGSLESFIHRSQKKWDMAEAYDFKDDDALVIGNPEAKITIVEFADFLCPHCQKAAPSLHSFIQSHSDTKLIFYAFPLDGSCNAAMKRQGGGERCRLAKATYCANKRGFGLEMHDYLFEKQQQMGSNDSINSTIKELIKRENPMLKFETFQECLESEETHEAILRHAKRGETAKIEGTPAIFLQGRKLEGGQILPILEAVYKKVKDKL